jgi:hypothetical protein
MKGDDNSTSFTTPSPPTHIMPVKIENIRELRYEMEVQLQIQKYAIDITIRACTEVNSRG